MSSCWACGWRTHNAIAWPLVRSWNGATYRDTSLVSLVLPSYNMLRCCFLLKAKIQLFKRWTCEIADAFQDLQDIQYIGEMSPMSQFRHFDLVICLWNDKMTGLGRQILNTFAWCAKLNGSRWQNKRTWRTVVRDVSWSKTSKIWYWIFCQILRARAHWRKQFPFTLCFMKLQGSLGVSAEVFTGLVGHMVPWPPRCLNWTGYEQLRV